MNEEECFVDILEPRRTQSGIFRFMTRDWRPKKTQVLNKNYTPQDIKDISARSVYLETVIEAEHARTGVSKEKLKKEILSYLEEIGLDKKMHVVRWLGMFLLKVSFNMNVGVYVNEPAILKIKASMGKNPILFLPTHRSYADFCMLTYLCYHYDIELPAVASGMDFYSMAVVGQAMRETGAFYMRRSLAGAPLYAAALRQYVRTLVAFYAAPVEFFLEGTRSRTNKSLPPKYGMLAMTLAPLVTRAVEDVTLVGVATSYDRLMEQGAFAYEHLGVPKPKESTRGLVRWVSSLSEQFGHMYINFTEPLSARELLKDVLAPDPDESLKPADLQELSPAQFAAVRSVGDAMVARQQAATVATAAHLLAAILANSLHYGQPVQEDRLEGELDWLRGVLVSLGARVERWSVGGWRRVLRVHARHWPIDHKRQLRLRLPPSVTAITPANDEILNPERVRCAVAVIQLQLSVNPLLHHLMPSALIALLAEKRSDTGTLRRRYGLLRRLLKHEFFYVETDEQQTFEKAFDFCVSSNVVSVKGGEVVLGGNSRLQFLLRWAAWPALRSLLLCADVMIQRGTCTEREAVKEVQKEVARSGSHPYCLSRLAVAACLRGLSLAGAIRVTNPAPSTTYQLVPEVMSECRELVSSVLPHFDVDFSCRHPVFIEPAVRSKI